MGNKTSTESTQSTSI